MPSIRENWNQTSATPTRSWRISGRKGKKAEAASAAAGKATEKILAAFFDLILLLFCIEPLYFPVNLMITRR